jgi:hypothetical protein
VGLSAAVPNTQGSGITPVQVSVARYASMHAAHEAGQAELTALLASAVRKQVTNAVADELQELAA